MMGCSPASHVLKNHILEPVCTRGGRTKDRFTVSNVTLCPRTFRTCQELWFPWQDDRRQGALTLRKLLRNPRGDHWLYIDILLREEDYAQVTDGCGRGTSKIVCLEDQIHIGAKLNAFSIGHREHVVVVQNAVECSIGQTDRRLGSDGVSKV